VLLKCLFAWFKTLVGVYLFEKTQFLLAPVINFVIYDSSYYPAFFRNFRQSPNWLLENDNIDFLCVNLKIVCYESAYDVI
jgi:hypothetical protein